MTPFTLAPKRPDEGDPRQELYHFPSMPVIVYAKKIAKFHAEQMLRMAEQIAHNLGYILVPASVLNWRKKQRIAEDRQVTIGQSRYYLMKHSELSRLDQMKLQRYVSALESVGS